MTISETLATGFAVLPRLHPTPALLCMLVAASACKASAQVGGRPNEPQGFSPLTEMSFDRGLADGWRKRPRDAVEFLPESRPGAVGQGIARAYYRAGFEAGSGPVRFDWDVEGGYTSLYLSFWVRLSENWVGHRSGVNKIFHLWIDGRNMVYLSAQGAGRGPFTAQVRLQGIAEESVSRNLAALPASARIQRGVWQQWELLVVANTPGDRNGRVSWWINGRRAGHADGIAFVKPGGKPEWTQVSWNPTWGGMGGQVGALQWMDIDDVYISAGK